MFFFESIVYVKVWCILLSRDPDFRCLRELLMFYFRDLQCEGSYRGVTHSVVVGVGFFNVLMSAYGDY